MESQANQMTKKETLSCLFKNSYDLFFWAFMGAQLTNEALHEL